MAAARDALVTPGAAVAREVLAVDLALLDDLDEQIAAAQNRVAALLSATDYQILTTTPGWSVVRVASYAAALGPRTRWASAAKVFLDGAADGAEMVAERPAGICAAPLQEDRAAGRTAIQHDSAGRRRDGRISPRGSVHLRRPLDRAGRWAVAARTSPPAPTLRPCASAASKLGRIIACALAHRANKIAFSLHLSGVHGERALHERVVEGSATNAAASSGAAYPTPTQNGTSPGAGPSEVAVAASRHPSRAVSRS